MFFSGGVLGESEWAGTLPKYLRWDRVHLRRLGMEESVPRTNRSTNLASTRRMTMTIPSKRQRTESTFALSWQIWFSVKAASSSFFPNDPEKPFR